MNEKTRRLLEFDKIQNAVAAYAKSAEAAALIYAQQPETTEPGLAALQKEITHAINRINSGDPEPGLMLPELAAILPKLGPENSVLNTEEFHALAVFLEEGERLLRWLEIKEIAAPEGTLSQIRAVIEKSGALRDLPPFKKIKAKIAVIRHEIETLGASFARNASTRAMLRSELPSVRNGRSVIAIKANFRGRIRGIVHEVSASGQTLFLEPEELVEKNNELRIEERALDAEIRRVLRELTAEISPKKAELEAFHAELVRIETIRARAHYACATRGIFAENSGFMIRAARHPLLGEGAVPIDIAPRAGIRALIISGPNAGGKTAALKTAGLFALMHASGFALPAEKAAFPVFDEVFADIGDEQSLSGALSTFSAHITNIADIIRRAGPRSLVLLDELGTGTGVEEGGALAMALLDSLIEKGALLFVTTHSGALKNYGRTRAGAENASMEFNTESGLPTYRVVMGVPGESRAVDIARRSGIPEDIINAALKYFEKGDTDTVRLIAGLQEKITMLDADRNALLEEQRELRNSEERLALREKKLREKEFEVKSGEAGNLRVLLKDARKKLENLVRELRESGVELEREKTSRVKDFLHDLENTIEDEDARLNRERAEEREIPEALAIPPGGIVPGLRVLVGERRRPGVIKRAGRRGTWIVETGSLSMPFAENEIYTAKEEKPAPVIAAPELALKEPVRSELDLRGMRLAEAVDTLRRALDSAVTAKLSFFAVIHGTGDGILQRGVHEFLKGEAAVADYYFSRPELGGAGRTEVVLRG